LQIADKKKFIIRKSSLKKQGMKGVLNKFPTFSHKNFPECNFLMQKGVMACFKINLIK